MRDGEVVLYLRPSSKVWQVRYKLFDRKWRCVSTRQRQLEWAKKVAGEIYDRARFREEEGLPQKSVRFDSLANECSAMRVDPITGKNRSFYSLRHCYATLALMDGQMDMHAVAKQMVTSVGMLEQQYSKMTATMADERLT